jgi:hypothetical protein
MSDDSSLNEEASGPRLCVDCRTVSPATQTSYTLISARYGWRLSFGAGKDGRKVAEWRCPACWGLRKNPKRP